MLTYARIPVAERLEADAGAGSGLEVPHVTAPGTDDQPQHQQRKLALYVSASAHVSTRQRTSAYADDQAQNQQRKCCCETRPFSPSLQQKSAPSLLLSPFLSFSLLV